MPDIILNINILKEYLKKYLPVLHVHVYVKVQIRIRPSSELVQPRSEFPSGLDQFRTGPANIRILIWAGPDQNPLIYNDKCIRDLDLGQYNS